MMIGVGSVVVVCPWSTQSVINFDDGREDHSLVGIVVAIP